MNFEAVRVRSGLIAKIAGGLLLLVALGAWALASPVGASPDEDYHLVSTWCGQGDRDGVCEPGVNDESRVVPQALLYSTCYAFHADISAQCQGEGFASSGETLVLSERGNFTGDYPPVFYFVMSLFVGDDISFSVIAMRLVNALFFVGLIGAVAALVPAGLRRAMLVGVAVSVVPLGMFIIPSLNPSSWALLSAATLLVSVLGYITTEDRRRRLALGALAGLALLVGAGARADSAMYAVVAIGAALILTVRPGRQTLRRLIYPLVLAVVAGISFLTAGQSSAVTGTEVPPLTLRGLADIFLTVPSLWTGALGSWGLGWLDTGMPPFVWVASSAVFAAVVFLAVGGADRRRALTTLAVAAAVWVVPSYIQYVSAVPVGAGVQPRYILPLMVLLAVTAAVRLEGAAFRMASSQRWVMVALLAAANAVALHTNIRRYVTGSDVPSLNLDALGEWWWGIPVSPLLVWALGAVAFAGGLVLLSAELVVDAPARREAAVPAAVAVPGVDSRRSGGGHLSREPGQGVPAQASSTDEGGPATDGTSAGSVEGSDGDPQRDGPGRDELSDARTGRP